MAYSERRSRPRRSAAADLTGGRRRERFSGNSEARSGADHCRSPLPVHSDGPQFSSPAGANTRTLKQVLEDAERAGGPNKGVWKRGKDAAGRARREFVVGFLGPDRPVTEITRADLHRLVRNLEARPGKKPGVALSPKTVNRYLAALSSILRFACLEGLLPNKPQMPTQSEDEGRIHWLTESQERLLCDFMASKGWLAESLTVSVLCVSGLRWGEFARLEPHEVLDWGTRTFKIAVDMVNEKLLTREEAIMRITPEDIERPSTPSLIPSSTRRP